MRRPDRDDTLAPDERAYWERRKAEMRIPFPEKHPALARAGLFLIGALVFAGVAWALGKLIGY